MISKLAFVLCAAICCTAPAWAAPDGLALAVGRFHDLTLADADPAGAERWAVWSEGSPGAAMVRLALFSVQGAKAAPVWRMRWLNAYGPVLRPTPEWTYGGRPLVAVTFQYGAAAQQLELYGLDGRGIPVRLTEKLSSLVGWTTSADGRLLLVLYDRPASALVPACYGWNDAQSALQPAPCPR